MDSRLRGNDGKVHKNDATTAGAPVRGSCPRCGFHSGIESFISESEYKSAIAAAAALPSDCGTVMLRYIGCFAPAKRGLNGQRASRLINELRDMIVDGTDYKRQQIKAPSYVWAQAMQATIEAENIRLPLKDHNYLLAIVQSSLNKRSEYAPNERAESRRNQEPGRVRSSGMQKADFSMGEGAAKAVATPLQMLPAEDQKAWMTKADKALQQTGINAAFITKLAIEAEANALILEAQS